jgi:hypothetical protein
MQARYSPGHLEPARVMSGLALTIVLPSSEGGIRSLQSWRPTYLVDVIRAD